MQVKQFSTLWSALDPRRRAIVIGATVAVFVAVLALARLAATPPMALLYAGLEPGSSGEVVQALEQRRVTYQIRGDSIFVAASARDELRMTLASEGLPANGGAGYELLDSLSGFGTTAQMFDAAYWRAKEGELARTIAASPRIRSARVHIAPAPAQPFRRDSRPTASVTVTTAGGTLSPDQARAFRHLVATAVAGLAPGDVAVIDSAIGLVAAEDDTSPARAAGNRAAELRRNAERLLAARVGPGKALVEVSVDLVTERESIIERRFDPETRVAISTETESRSDSASGGDPAGVTVASNLPEGDAAGAGESRSQSNETRERVNYEVSEVQRELERAPGSVRRLTVAVLVDGLRDGDGLWQPRPDEELADLRELVASAVGFDADRGDTITLRSMAFEPVPEEGTLAGGPGFPLDPMTLAQLGVAALVALILGLFVLRPILTQGRAAPMTAPAALPGAASTTGPVLTGEIAGDDTPAQLTVVPAPENEAPADPVERLRKLIADRQDESIEILRGWMEERGESR
ncbi:MAG: flagellar basal-body MS-ring/collar protein FliF [Gemmobacter sp.]